MGSVMSQVKISAMPTATNNGSGAYIPIVQSGINKKLLADSLVRLAQTNKILGYLLKKDTLGGIERISVDSVKLDSLLATISGGAGSIEYLTQGYGVIIDSVGRVYTIKVDSSVLANKLYVDALAALKKDKADSINSTGYATQYDLTKTKDSLQTNIDTKISSIGGLVTAGTNVTITGSGTTGSPYVVNSSDGGAGNDSAYVNIIYLNDSTLIFVRDNDNKDTIRLSAPIVFTRLLNGLVPASGGAPGDTTKFLREDGQFKSPTVGGGGLWALNGVSGAKFSINNAVSGYVDSFSIDARGRVFLGFGAGALSQSGSAYESIGIGYKALNKSDSTGNVVIANNGLRNLTTGFNNTVINAIGTSMTSANNNILIGKGSGGALTTQTGNIHISGGAASTASNNIFIGGGNSATTLASSVSLGGLSSAVTGLRAVAIGPDALYSLTAANEITGLGYAALYFNSTGAFNLGLGARAGMYNTTASNQIFINSITRSGNYMSDQNNSPFYAQQNQTTLLTQYITHNGKFGINTIAPTAWLHLSRGTTVANTAPLKFAANVSLTTTAATGTGTVATLTYATTTNPAFVLGSTIVVSGVTPSGYNGTFVVTAVTATTVSFANATTGAQTVAGTITQGALLTTPEAGAVEFDGRINVTGTDAVRGRVALTFTGTAAPATTPSFVGDYFVDTVNKKLYVATGTVNSADWTILN